MILHLILGWFPRPCFWFYHGCNYFQYPFRCFIGSCFFMCLYLDHDPSFGLWEPLLEDSLFFLFHLLMYLSASVAGYSVFSVCDVVGWWSATSSPPIVCSVGWWFHSIWGYGFWVFISISSELKLRYIPSSAVLCQKWNILTWEG